MTSTVRQNAHFSPRVIWLLTVVCCALALVVASMAALNTALPQIAPDIHASSSQLTWLIDGYTLVLAALLLPAGAIGDRFGRREILIAGLVIFAVASALPVWINDVNLIIATRCLAGGAAAFVMPATLSLITSGVPATKRPVAVAIWSGVASAGAIMGFFVTGLLLEFFSWHSVFIAFSASGIVVILMSLTVSSSRDTHARRFDILGSVTSISSIGLTVFALVEAPGRGWGNPLVLSVLAGGLALGTAFVIIEIHTPSPLLDVRLFLSRAFSAGALSVLMAFLASFGAFYLVLQELQLVFGYSPLMSAVALLPMVATVMVFSLLGNWFAVKFSLRIAIPLGTFLIGLALVLMATLSHPTIWPLEAILIVAAVGIGIAAAPSTTAIMMNTPPDAHGIGSAVNDTARELGAAIGIAIAGSIVAAGYDHRIGATVELAEQGLRGKVSLASSLGNSTAAQQLTALIPAVGEHIRRSFAEAMEVARQVTARIPGPLGHQIATSAQHVYLTAMNSACIALGSILMVATVILVFLTPKRIGESDRTSTDDKAPV